MRRVDLDTLTLRVAARYKSKKVLDTGTVVYEYGPRQVAKRNQDKADRVEGLRKSIEKLRKKVKSDLKSKDPSTKLTALAIALIDHTYERVGNEDSAEEGHFGVTGWQRQHVSFGKGTATIKYVGKSGVKHEKKVTDKEVLAVLREAYDQSKEGKESCLFQQEDTCVTSKEVNSYLKEFDVTAKDLRGFHANREMQERLREIRKKGPELPKGRKDRDKILKKEFTEALEGTAEAVGHEASTLKSQYLVPSLEESFMHDGSVIDKLNEKLAMDCQPDPPLLFANRIIRQFVDHMGGGDLVMEEPDFQAVRILFRRLGGAWEKVLGGDMADMDRLKKVITAWSTLPGRKKDQERV